MCHSRCRTQVINLMTWDAWLNLKRLAIWLWHQWLVHSVQFRTSWKHQLSDIKIQDCQDNTVDSNTVAVTFIELSSTLWQKNKGSTVQKKKYQSFHRSYFSKQQLKIVDIRIWISDLKSQVKQPWTKSSIKWSCILLEKNYTSCLGICLSE